MNVISLIFQLDQIETQSGLCVDIAAFAFN